MSKLTLKDAIEKAKVLKNNKDWRDFKTKWDNNIPNINSPKFDEYQKDCDRITKVVERI